MEKAIPKFLKIREKLPPKDTIKAVYFLAFCDDLIVSVPHGKEWDIPGEKLKNGCEMRRVLKKDILEKNRIRCDDAKPYIVLNSKEIDEAAVVFISNSVTLENDASLDNGNMAELISIDMLLRRYGGGDAELLWVIIQKAREKLDLAYW